MKRENDSLKTKTNQETLERCTVIHHGENTRHYRTAKKLSEEYMASELEMSLTDYNRLERSAVIEEELLGAIAEILNLGIEWLRDILIINDRYYRYHQDGNGNTNFQNTDDINYNINYPVENVVDAYRENIETLKESLLTERKERQEILNKFITYVESQKK